MQSKAIDKILDEYRCPYCDREAKSASGKTLHRKKCKELKKAVIAQSNFKVGQTITHLRKEHQIVQLKDGLALLDDDSIICINALKKTVVKIEPLIVIKSPATIKQWVKEYRARKKKIGINKFKQQIKMLFKHSSYVQYKKWDEEALDKVLETTK